MPTLPSKRLGVVGTMVWDTIFYRDVREHPAHEWGGICYGLSALEASLPPEWEIVPLLKVGSDLAEEALRFLHSLPRVRVGAGVVIVPAPNNRVEIHYEGEARRTERLEGGVPPWAWVELAPLVRECDAVYVNFISGFEMGLDTARALRAGYDGPTYGDLHSLFLGVGGHGIRVPQMLPSWGDWLRCFDAVQMNEQEFELLGRATGDPWELASNVVGPELKLITVTLGERGVAYVAGAGFDADPETWSETRRRVATPGTARSGMVPVEGGRVSGDPTGCGDVWGATFLARLIGGDALEVALARANQMAAKNVEHRGAEGLHRHLVGRLSTEGGVQ